MSGGGAQSCLMGVTGNSALFTKYIEENGAAMKDSEGNELKDNVKGSQCWCPITNLDTADAAYEWNMGQYFTTGTRASDNFTKLLSEDLADEYVKYVNNIKLKDPQGNELTLTSRNEGTYYNYLKSVIEESLNNFFQDTTFPYTPDERPHPPHNTELTVTYQTIQDESHLWCDKSGFHTIIHSTKSVFYFNPTLSEQKFINLMNKEKKVCIEPYALAFCEDPKIQLNKDKVEVLFADYYSNI